MPVVSVIIPTYNRIDLLGETLQSVRQQTFEDCEIIVVDDGSTDGTADWLTGLGPPVRLVALEHSGRLDWVRNQGLAAATGDLIAFLDSDDLWQPDKLAQQVSLMGAEPALGMVFTDVALLLPDGTTTPPLLTVEQKRSDGVFRRLLSGSFIHPSTVMVRRSLFERLGPFETRFRTQGEYIFWLRAARVAAASCIRQPLVTVRRSASSMSQTASIQLSEDAIEALRFFISTEALSLLDWLVARRTLSRWTAHLGLARMESDPMQARGFFLRSLGLNPLQRRAWVALLEASRRERRDQA